MKEFDGLTLIELLISLVIASLIAAAIYFTLNTALESWGYSRDQLSLQKVVSETMDEVVNGGWQVYGIKDGLEVISAGSGRIEFTPPWTDDTHTVAGKEFIYTLNRKLKPGTAPPIGEIKLPEADQYQSVPVENLELEDASVSQVRLKFAAPPGSQLRFTYHPDNKANPDVIKVIWYDAKDQQVYTEDTFGRRSISANSLGVKITGLRFSYYDNTNKLIIDQESVDENDLVAITGVEVQMEAQLGQYKDSLVSFTNLRNAPLRSGYLALREGMRILIPDSRNINTFLLTNISGVSSGDELQIEATPDAGKAWRLNIKFSRIGSSKPTIESYAIEYPAHHPVYTEFPKSSIDLGLDFLTLGGNGLYDYDDDKDIEDSVILEGKVILEVKKMDIEGAALFIRP